MGYQVSFLEGKWPGFEGESTHPEQSLRMSGARPVLLHIPLWHALYFLWVLGYILAFVRK